VLAEGENHGVGRISGAQVTTPHFGIAVIRQGRIAELRVYRSLDEALDFAVSMKSGG
jgi:hypothetical protein